MSNNDHGYEPYQWQKGRSRFTAERMNHIEKGIAGTHARMDQLEERLAAIEQAREDDSE